MSFLREILNAVTRGATDSLDNPEPDWKWPWLDRLGLTARIILLLALISLMFYLDRSTLHVRHGMLSLDRLIMGVRVE